MEYIKDLLNDLRLGILGLKVFEVQVTVPKGYVWKGEVPFDVHIVRDQAFVTLEAPDLETATFIAREFFSVQEED
jgi:hypothetical protein